MNVRSRGLFALVLAVMAVPRLCEAGEPATGAKPDVACLGCHGPAGDRPISPQIPRLAGQPYDYLVEALRQYRNGARTDPIMGAMAKGLSGPQMLALARYYSTQSGVMVKY